MSNYDAALTYLNQAVRLAQEDRNKRLEMTWVKSMGDVHAEKGDYDTARAHYDRVLQEVKDGFLQLRRDPNEEGHVFFEDTSNREASPTGRPVADRAGRHALSSPI